MVYVTWCYDGDEAEDVNIVSCFDMDEANDFVKQNNLVGVADITAMDW